MSEYWVSHKKYYCKYCEIYIADDAPSRSHHENGLRHQGNKERYIKNLYKTGEKKKRDDEEEKREMARIDQAAQAAFANDVQSGRAKASTSSSVPISKPAAPKAPERFGGGMANYTTAKDLGIAQEEEKLAAEALALQQSQGVVGQWEVVEISSTTAALASSVLPQKRSHQDEDDEEGAGYRVRRRKLAEGLGEIYDPGEITLEPKRESQALTEESTNTVEDAQPKPAAITWSKKRWKMADGDDLGESDEEKPAETFTQEDAKHQESVSSPNAAQEPDNPPVAGAPPEEPVEVAPAKGMFKKRKAPTQSVGAKKGIRKQL